MFGSTKAKYVSTEKGHPNLLIQDLKELPTSGFEVKDPPDAEIRKVLPLNVSNVSGVDYWVNELEEEKILRKVVR